jgi:hypothetical protein
VQGCTVIGRRYTRILSIENEDILRQSRIATYDRPFATMKILQQMPPGLDALSSSNTGICQTRNRRCSLGWSLTVLLLCVPSFCHGQAQNSTLPKSTIKTSCSVGETCCTSPPCTCGTYVKCEDVSCFSAIVRRTANFLAAGFISRRTVAHRTDGFLLGFMAV